jgi:hypothetical protein
MKKLLIACLIFFTLPFTAAFAQHSDESSNIKRLQAYQNSLAELGNTFINNENDLERKNANYEFIKTLVAALKVPNSFLFPFDSLKTISIQNSPDNRFRIFSWHITNDDGSYRFFGAIQMNTGGMLKLFPLEDYTPFLKTPEDSVLSNRKWYGAQYYKIIKVNAEHPYYTLLGWKGNNAESTKKVIEILSFKNDMPVFGAAEFGLSKNKKRIIFEYTRQASMLLRFVPEQDLIVFDHLAPPDDSHKNDSKTFGPDLTYDGYKLKNGHWVLVENLDMRNVPDSRDEDYIAPKRASKVEQSSN